MANEEIGKIRFTWGGRESYSVNLCIHPGDYRPVVFGIASCFEAQRITQRGNEALKLWRPDLLSDGTELIGVGFQYSKPNPDTISTVPGEALTLAMEIADDAAPEFITSGLVPVSQGDDVWYDLNSASEDFKANIEGSLRYCELRGLIKRHPELPNLIQTLEP